MRSPFKHVQQVIALLEPTERRKLALVALGATLMALIEVIGVGSIMPFMAVASKPDSIKSNAILSWTYGFFGFSSETAFLIFLGCCVLAFLILTNVSQAFLQFIKIKFTSMRRHTLSLKLFRGYLGQDYPFFLSRNSYEFVKNINTEINQLINGTLIQFIEFISRLIQVLVLVSFLLVVNPGSSLLVVTIVVTMYGSIYYTIRRTIKRLGANRFSITQELSRIVSEAFWGIKEVKITGTERVFLDEFVNPSKELAKNESTTELVGDIPKFALETAAFSAIMLFVLITIVKEGSFANAAATVTLFAFAGYRLIPAVQGVFKAYTKVKYSAPTAERMVQEYRSVASEKSLPDLNPRKMEFCRLIEFRDLVFAYPGAEKDLFTDLNLSIQCNSLTGFAGKTGSGKTTAVDILMGLLKPRKGGILIDGVLLDENNIREWQANVGYVPQNIYLSNDTLAANIAFGVSKDMIEPEMLERAARMAQLHDFVTTELKDGYDTYIGERGIRLSGGQRQRVGIARALYRNPSVLVMDEATSALDNQTERAVMEAIDNLQGTKTIILIAHRLSTLVKCNQIYLIENGKILGTGDIEYMEKNHSNYFLAQ